MNRIRINKTQALEIKKAIKSNAREVYIKGNSKYNPLTVIVKGFNQYNIIQNDTVIYINTNKTPTARKYKRLNKQLDIIRKIEHDLCFLLGANAEDCQTYILNDCVVLSHNYEPFKSDTFKIKFNKNNTEIKFIGHTINIKGA